MTIFLVLVAWLLTYLLHSTILLSGAWLLTSLRLVRSPAGRDTLWKVALIGGILTATAQGVFRLDPLAGHVALDARDDAPYVHVASVRPARPAADIVPTQPVDDVAALAPVPPADVAAPQVRTLLPNLHMSWPGVLLNFWLIGAIGFGLRLVWLRLELARRIRNRTPLREGPLAETLTMLAWDAGVAAPRLSVSDTLPGPVAFAGEIVVPSRVVTTMGKPAQRAVLAHELGHIVRRDPRWLVAASVIETLLFLQPLNVLARRRLQETAEYCSDEWAARRTGGLELARCLAEVAAWMHARPQLAVVAGLAEHGSQLVTRVERLLAGSPAARRGRQAVLAAASAAAITAVAWGAPGVAAQDLSRADHTDPGGEVAADESAWQVRPVAWTQEMTDGEGWAAVRDCGHLFVLGPGWTVRLTGSGPLGFRQWGRAFAVPEDWRIEVDGRPIEEDLDLFDAAGGVRFVGPNGAWTLTPVRAPGLRAYAGMSWGDVDEIAHAAQRLTDRYADAHDDADQDADSHVDRDTERSMERALEAEIDAVVDSIVEIWQRDPDAAQRVARRLARSLDRELKPQLAQLGAALGRELAPELARTTARTVEQLGPEIERLGVSIGQTLAEAFGALSDEDVGGRPGRRGKKTY